MNIPKDLKDYQCLGFIPVDKILNLAWFELNSDFSVIGCEWKTVVDFWAWLSKLSARFLNAKSICAIDPMYFLEKNYLWNNWFEWTSKIITKTLQELHYALINNKEINNNIDFYWILSESCETIEKYKHLIGRIITDYEKRFLELLWAEEAIKSIDKFRNTSHIKNNTVDIIFINALLFDSSYPIDILSEVNRIVSEKWEIIIVDYIKLWQNKIFEKVKKSWLKISWIDDNFFCVKLKKDDYKKIPLWRDFWEYNSSQEEIIVPMETESEDRKIEFEWRQISMYQKINERYLNNPESYEEFVNKTKTLYSGNIENMLSTKKGYSESKEIYQKNIKEREKSEENYIVTKKKFEKQQKEFAETLKESIEIISTSEKILTKDKKIQENSFTNILLLNNSIQIWRQADNYPSNWNILKNINAWVWNND